MKSMKKVKTEGLINNATPENKSSYAMASISIIKQFFHAKGKKVAMGIIAVGVIATTAFSFIGCTPNDPTPGPGPDNPPNVNPDNPNQPDNPDVPVDPDVPDVPVDPDQPVNPDVPVDPDVPVNPDNPDIPVDPTPTPGDRVINETLGYAPDFDYSELSFAELYPSERRVIAENVKDWVTKFELSVHKWDKVEFLGLEIVPEKNEFVPIFNLYGGPYPKGILYINKYVTNEDFTMDTLLKNTKSLTSKYEEAIPLFSCSPMTNSDNATEDIKIKMDGVANKITGKTDYDYVTYQKNGGGFVDGYLDCGCQDMRISMLDGNKIDLYDIIMKADGDTKDPVLEHIINGTENDGTAGVGTYRIARKQSYEFKNLFFNFRSGIIFDHEKPLSHINDANSEKQQPASFKIVMANKVIGVSENGKITMYRDLENE